MQTTHTKSAPPKRMKQKDWKGRTVVLRRSLTTRGGERFEEGARMEVVICYRGYLELWALPHRRNPDGGMSSIGHVSPDDVTLVD